MSAALPMSDPTSPDLPETTAADEPTRVPLRLEDWLTVVSMALLALITFANVLVRYFTDQSFAWTEEFSVFLLIVMTLVGASAAVARNRHIRIEFLADGGTPQRRHRLALLGALAMALLFFVIAVLSVRMVWDHYIYEEISPGLGLPQWWYSIWLPVLSLAIGLRAVGRFNRLRRAGVQA